MPGIAWAAIVLWGALTGSSLTDREGYRPHHPKGLSHKAQVEYRTWTSSPNILRDGSCEFTIFALVTRSTLVEARIGDRHYSSDWSFSRSATIPLNHSGTIEVVFLELGTGKVLAHHTVREVCWKVTNE